jgi:hypothetical protein
MCPCCSSLSLDHTLSRQPQQLAPAAPDVCDTSQYVCCSECAPLEAVYAEADTARLQPHPQPTALQPQQSEVCVSSATSNVCRGGTELCACGFQCRYIAYSSNTQCAAVSSSCLDHKADVRRNALMQFPSRLTVPTGCSIRDLYCSAVSCQSSQHSIGPAASITCSALK